MSKVYRSSKKVDLPTSDLEWFDREYPNFSLSALLTMLLHNFRRIHEDVGATPRKMARDSAKEILAEIKEGLIEGVEYKEDED